MSHHLDITHLKRAYEESPDSFRRIIKDLSIGVGIYDQNAKPIECNESAHRLLGLTRDQFLGNSAMDPYWKVTHKNGDKFEPYDFPIIQAITNYEPIYGVLMGVSRPFQNDKVWLEVNTYPILKSDGSVDYLIVTYKDVSEFV